MNQVSISSAAKKIGAAVDRLISVDMSARGFITVLYEEAIRRNDGKPLCLTAAHELMARSAPNGHAVIATGLPIRGWLTPEMAENDGPIGAASLARAMYLALRAVPIMLCEKEQIAVLKACLQAVGMTPVTFAQYDAARSSSWAVPGRDLPIAIVHGFSARLEDVETESEMILTRKPYAMISIERQGRTERGTYHYGRGEQNIPELMAKIDELFERAKARGIFTIGIGDGGNEIGMANIAPAIRERLPFGTEIVPDVEVSLLVSATVSNFGAYGIEACLAALSGNLAVLHTPAQEHALIEACVRTGAVDGVTGFVEPYVDALPAELCAGLVTMLHAIVKNGLAPSKIFAAPPSK